MNVWIESAGGPLLVARVACSVQGYIGLVDIGGQQALVLGDEPAATTYLADERLFLRWAAADSEAELIAAAKRASGKVM